MDWEVSVFMYEMRITFNRCSISRNVAIPLAVCPIVTLTQVSTIDILFVRTHCDMITGQQRVAQHETAYLMRIEDGSVGLLLNCPHCDDEMTVQGQQWTISEGILTSQAGADVMDSDCNHQV